MEKGKNKLKQSELKVKMITTMKKQFVLKLAYSFSVKQTLLDLYEIVVIKNLKEVHQIF